MSKSIKGRGTSEDLSPRFNSSHINYHKDEETGQVPSPDTQFINDHPASIITKNNSPDIPFKYSLNPYRGCEHGCAYCYARPTHEYLGYSPGLEFESKIVVKKNAPDLLKKELSSSGWNYEVIAISGVTDCYQPAEKKLQITRQCLGVLADFNNPAAIITKNYLVTRDIDHLSRLAKSAGCRILLSITTLDKKLASSMEPRTSRPGRRLEAIEKLSEAGIPTGVMVAPVIPGLTDHEIPAILEAARNHGAEFAGYVPLRLPHGVKDLFIDWLENNLPDKAQKVVNRIKSMRKGKLNSTSFGDRMKGSGPYAQQIKQLFNLHVKRLGMDQSKRSALKSRGGLQKDLFL